MMHEPTWTATVVTAQSLGQDRFFLLLVGQGAIGLTLPEASAETLLGFSVTDPAELVGQKVSIRLDRLFDVEQSFTTQPGGEPEAFRTREGIVWTVLEFGSPFPSTPPSGRP